ncbi:hypothetical protein LUZ63_003613 [Rhynchospora breviuscula]|uniref:RING-type E3 ubiquitin transferase n=1 Tax=Rhynchospora breviuscula TaxID=2022672 RepID=A0A9Q0D2B4_9POAL|nr:hypothetical protein LUZ63_003613 [Rhynchospora breviuscula]
MICFAFHGEKNQSKRISKGVMDGGDHTTVKHDLLKCSICCEALCAPISQCTDGHALCSSCHLKLSRDCIICALQPICTYARTLEKIAESAPFPCRNTKYGCSQYLSFSQIQQHENTCNYSPCFCPNQNCSFEGSKQNLMFHLAEHHSALIRFFRHDEQFSVKLCSSRITTCLLSEDNFLYLIIRKDTALGWAVSVVCIRPAEATKPEFQYKLSLKCDGEFSLRLETRIESTTLINGFPADKHFLMIPSEFCSSGCVKLNVCIRKNPA